METIFALLVIGAILLILETILPGLVAGIAGVCCLIAGIVITYQDFGLNVGNAVLFGVIAALTIGAAVWIKFFPNSRMARPFISNRTIGGIGAERPELINKTGTAHTNLRPSGTAIIEGQRVDVVADGQMISKGTTVKVVQIEGMRVVVRAV